MTSTATAAKVSFSKGTDRYNVHLDGTKIGWVSKNSDGWAFYATVRQWHVGEKLAYGEATRRDAVMEGISRVRIHHGSGIRVLDMETIEERWEVWPSDVLQATWEALLDEKYPVR